MTDPAARNGQDSPRRVAVLTHTGRPAAVSAANRLVEGLSAAGILSVLPPEDLPAIDPRLADGVAPLTKPLRADDDPGPAATVATTMGDVTVVALITDHESALVTPALYRVEVERVVSSSVDHGQASAPQIRFLRSYLGAYRGAFRAGERICASGQLLALQPGDDLLVELTDWTGTRSYGARLVE